MDLATAILKNKATWTQTIAGSMALALSCLCSAQAEDNGDAQALIQRLATKHRVCAVSVAVIKDRQLQGLHFASGCDPALAVDARSVFEAASLGKPVFSYAVLQLIAQGKIGLDVPLLTYLPKGYVHRQNPFNDRATSKTDLVSDPRIAQVTTRMVLNHTTGLPNWSRTPLCFDTDPGATWQYSGEGYMLLQRAVETFTGQPLDAFMRSQVFEPLSMTSSAYTWGANSGTALVPAMAADRTRRKLKPFVVPVAPTSLYTSAADYGRFVVALLNDRATLKEVTNSPVTVSRPLDLQWGLGWAIERADDGLFIWHWGNNLGYRSFVMASIETGDGFVMFTDSDDGMALAEPIAQLVLPGKHKLFNFSMLH